MRFRRWENTRLWAELWIEMDDRAHLLFNAVFFDAHEYENPPCCQNYMDVKDRLKKAIEMIVF